MRARFAFSAWMAAFVLFLGLPGLASAQPAGKVTVSGVTGTVTAGGRALANGQQVPIGTEIKTGPGSTAVLVFSNGSTVTVSPSTTMRVERFRQTPVSLPAGTSVGSLREEPSNSNTRIKLEEGQVIGDVKRLRAGSSFEIDTPAGIAGVLGTKIAISVTKNVDGSVSVTWNVTEGNIGFTPNGNVTIPASQAAKLGNLAAGESITFNLVLDGDKFVVQDAVRGTVPESVAQQVQAAVAVSANAALAVVLEAEAGESGVATPDREEIDLLPNLVDPTPGAGTGGQG